MKNIFNIRREPLIVLVSIGLAIGLFITGLTWVFPASAKSLFTGAAWFWTLILVGTLLTLTGAKLAQEQDYPAVPKPILLLAVVAATALVYLFPELFAPGCGGMPRAFAACPAACRITTCSDWAGPGERGCGAKPPNKGCCFAYETTCDPSCNEPDPTPAPTNQPPAISGSVGCTIPGSAGWCKSGAVLNMSASDPQGFSTTITGDIAGEPFSCSGPNCSQALPAGSGTIHFQATAPSSGLSSAVGSTSFAFDPTPPSATLVISGITGASGWYKSAAASTTGSDATSGLASTQVSVDGGAWQPSAALSEGIHSVVGRAIDNAGNVTISSVQTVKVDATAPNTSASVTSGTLVGGWYVSDVVVKANASDLTSGMDLLETRLDGGAWAVGDQLTVTTDGVHALDVSAIDKAGNVASLNMVIRKDVTPPSLSIPSIPDGLNGWYVTLPTLSLAASDSTSGLASALFSNGKTTTAITANGVFNLSAIALDNAGNSTPAATTIRVDTTPPLMSVTAPTPDGLNGWFLTAPTFSLSASDATSGLSSALFGNGQATMTITDDGIFNVNATARDNAGNTSPYVASVKKDSTPPSLSLLTNPDGLNGWYVTRPSLSLVASDATSGLASAIFENGTDSFTTKDGTQVVSATATDKAGNTSSTSQILKVDTIPPTLTPSISASGSNGWYNSAVTISLNAMDTISGVEQTEYSLDGGVWHPGSSLTVSTEGFHTVEMKVRDNAGNTATATRSFKVDTTKPVSAFSNPPEGTQIKAAGTVSFTGTSSDALSGLAATEISLDGGETWLALPSSGGAWFFSWDTLRVPDGLYTILVHADDQAGNRENTAKVQVILGNRPPKVEISPSWWLWESGYIKIQQRQIPLRDVTVRIACEPNHPDVVLKYTGENFPSELKWDRLCGNGAYAAESGDYSVTLTGCDTFGHCAESIGVIKVPFIAPPVPTWTPTFAPSPTSIEPTRQKPTPTQQVVILVTPAPAIIEPTPVLPPKSQSSSLWVWVLTAFALGFSFISLSDPRPRALHRLAQTIQKMEFPHDEPFSN